MGDQLSERQQNRLFKRLLGEAENSCCADCKVKGTSWASLGFGVFICIHCSGAHRNFGAHITRVRSVKLDKWAKFDAIIMSTVGNAIGNMYWEHRTEDAQNSLKVCENSLGDYIKQKYVMGLFAKEAAVNPVQLAIERKFDIRQKELVGLYSQDCREDKLHLSSIEADKHKSNAVELNEVNDFDLLDFGEDDASNDAALKVSVRGSRDCIFDVDLAFEAVNNALGSDKKENIMTSQDVYFVDFFDASHQHEDSYVHDKLDTTASHKTTNTTSTLDHLDTCVLARTPEGPNVLPLGVNKYSIFDLYKTYGSLRYINRRQY